MTKLLIKYLMQDGSNGTIGVANEQQFLALIPNSIDWKVVGTEEEEAQIVSAEPNWDALFDECVSGDLKPLYGEIIAGSTQNLGINTAFTILIAVLQRTRTEQALKDGLDILFGSDFTTSQANIDLWNTKINLFNFSDLVKL